MLEHYQQADYSHFCPACLNEKGLQPRCPLCHYDESKAVENPLYLQPRTLLKQQYLIGNVIGQGGFGITYIGLDINLHRKVAIKEYLPTSIATRAPHHSKESCRYTVIPWRHTQDHAFTGGLRSFLAEARKLAEFNHPYIVHVINYFEEHQTGYIVMDYVEGEDISSFLKNQGGRVSEAEALAWFFQILQALQEVHAKNLFHRDISAQNIRLTIANVPVLIDFGAAKYVTAEISRSLVDIYKLGYSPIEQMLGRKEIGAWTDIYASGALLYLMLTGKLPPVSVDRLEKDELIPPMEVKGVQISASLNQVILQALAVRIDDRFKTVEEFEQALCQAVTSPPAPIVPVTHQATPTVTRARTTVVWKYAVAVVVLLGVVATTLWLLPRFVPRQTANHQEVKKSYPLPDSLLPGPVPQVVTAMDTSGKRTSDDLSSPEGPIKDRQSQTLLTLEPTEWYLKVYYGPLVATDINGNPIIDKWDFELDAKSGPTVTESAPKLELKQESQQKATSKQESQQKAKRSELKPKKPKIAPPPQKPKTEPPPKKPKTEPPPKKPKTAPPPKKLKIEPQPKKSQKKVTPQPNIDSLQKSHH